MWPYTQDEAQWLARSREGAAAEQTQRAVNEACQRAVNEAWMTEIGIMRQPANDEFAFGLRMVDPRR